MTELEIKMAKRLYKVIDAIQSLTDYVVVNRSYRKIGIRSRNNLCGKIHNINIQSKSIESIESIIKEINIIK